MLLRKLKPFQSGDRKLGQVRARGRARERTLATTEYAAFVQGSCARARAGENSAPGFGSRRRQRELYLLTEHLAEEFEGGFFQPAHLDLGDPNPGGDFFLGFLAEKPFFHNQS